jgi:hypothetical protein
MKLIAHRGNYNYDKQGENSPEKIDYCINKLGYDVEIDLYSINNNLFLGHDAPIYPITLKYLYDNINNLWIHCKNEEALYSLIHTNFNYFWHQNDDFTLTSYNFIWTYPEKQQRYSSKQVILDFDPITKEKYKYYKSKCIYGLCSDIFLIDQN